MEWCGFFFGLGDHFMQCALGQAVGAQEVETEYAVHLLVEVSDRGFAEAVADEIALLVLDVVGDAAIAYNPVQAPVVVIGTIDEGKGGIGNCEVGAEDQNCHAVGFSYLGSYFFGPVGARVIVDDHVVAAGGEFGDDGGADTAGGTGDQADRTRQHQLRCDSTVSTNCSVLGMVGISSVGLKGMGTLAAPIRSTGASR